eukprot:11200624-Lingulodinium_polyedra.AAC.1
MHAPVASDSLGLKTLLPRARRSGTLPRPLGPVPQVSTSALKLRAGHEAPSGGSLTSGIGVPLATPPRGSR